MSEEIDDSGGGSKKESFLQIPSNQVLFYDDVTNDSIFNLNRNIDSVSKTMQLLKINYNLQAVPPVDILINSAGGEIFSAFSTVDRIISSKVPIHTYVEGVAASAATLLSVVGHRRFIRKNSFMLIHQLSSEIWGNFEQIRDETKNLEMVMKYIKKIYLDHTKISEKELTEMLKHDRYMDADECLSYGLVDEII